MRALHVIRREYRESVRKRSFIVSTLLVPLFMAFFFVVPILVTTMVPDRRYDAVVLDGTGEIGAELAVALDDTLKNGERQYVVQVVDARGAARDPERAKWLDALQRGGVDMILDVRESVFEDGKVAYITREERGFQILEDFETALTEIVIGRRLAHAGLDYEQVKKLATNVRLDVNQINAAGDVEEKHFMAEWGVVFVFVMILYSALLTWGLSISRGIVEEKGSRVMEVLLSSIRPKELLIGKVVGLGLAGLTQISIWGAFGALFSAYAASATAELWGSIHVAPAVFVYFVVYFLLGFLLYASVFTVIGSMCSTEQDAQQLQGIVTMPMLIPVFVLMFIMQSPNDTLSVVLSLIPFFAPMVMLARIILLEPPAWQVALSIALLAASIYWAVAFSARVFRVGVLMYGKRPSIREVVRWYRQAG